MLVGFSRRFWLLRVLKAVPARSDALPAASGTREQEPDALVAHPQAASHPETRAAGQRPEVLTGRQRRLELPSSRCPRGSGLRRLRLPPRPGPAPNPAPDQKRGAHLPRAVLTLHLEPGGRVGCAAWRGEHRETRSQPPAGLCCRRSVLP